MEENGNSSSLIDKTVLNAVSANSPSQMNTGEETDALALTTNLTVATNDLDTDKKKLSDIVNVCHDSEIPTSNVETICEKNENTTYIGDRPTSLRLESVLEYTGKIKAFLGLEDEFDQTSDTQTEKNVGTEEQSDILQDVEDQQFEPDIVSEQGSAIAFHVPDVLEPVIEPNSADLEDSANRVPDLINTNAKEVAINLNLNTGQKSPDIIGTSQAAVDQNNTQVTCPIPDILDSSTNLTEIESSNIAIPVPSDCCDVKEATLDTEGAKIVNEYSPTLHTGNYNTDNKISEVGEGETAAKIGPVTEREYFYDTTGENDRLDGDPVNADDEVKFEEEFTFNDITSIEELESKLTYHLQNSTNKDTDVENVTQKNDREDYGEFDFDDTEGILKDKLDLGENQMNRIEVGLRSDEENAGFAEDEIPDRAMQLEASQDDINVASNPDDSSGEGSSRPSMRELRRLSTEMVNSVLQSAGEQVKVILRERESTILESQPSSSMEQDVESTLAPSDCIGETKENLSGENEDIDVEELSPFSSQSIPPQNMNLTEDSSTETIKNKDIKMDIISEIAKADVKYEMKESEFDPDTQCGIGFFKPECLQRFANARTYLILYSIVGILHGSYYTYLVGVLTTLEKRFAFKSKTSGSIMMLDELTPLFLGVIVGHFGGRAHRPRFLSFGMFLSAFCCFASALPYFLYGTSTHLSSISTPNKTVGPEMCEVNLRINECEVDDKPQNMTAILLLMLGSFLKGFGNLAYYAIGLAYLDDNSKKKDTPLFFAIAIALRLVGPMVGYLMSSGFLKYYENPYVDPGFGPDDPRWIGGWWMGFCLQGVLLLIFAGPLALFPRRLPGHKLVTLQKQEDSSNPFEGLGASLKRLCRNPLYVILLLNTVMVIYGNFGFYIMLPKYMENQFRLSASSASIFSGPPGIAALMISTILGGYLIWRFKPNAKFLAGGLVILEVISTSGYLFLMIPQCEKTEMANFGFGKESLVLKDECNLNCNCSTLSFTPICGPDGKTTYFSPCYAGCSSQNYQTYSNCSCITNNPEDDVATKGMCNNDSCWPQTMAYVITLPIIQFFINILRVAYSMILLRSIKPEDKNIALGVFEAVISTIAFIPFPVLYGALVDSACLIWEEKCGETGNCWFYDMKMFNYLLHGASAFFSSLSILCLIAIFCLINRVQNLYDDEHGDMQQNESNTIYENEEMNKNAII